jgi:hypothetical protein
MGITALALFFFAELESINKKAGYNSTNYLYGRLEELYLLPFML